MRSYAGVNKVKFIIHDLQANLKNSQMLRVELVFSF